LVIHLEKITFIWLQAEATFIINIMLNPFLKIDYSTVDVQQRAAL